MSTIHDLREQVQQHFSDLINSCDIAFNELTVELPKQNLLHVCKALKEEDVFQFEQLMDVCGVDYLEYGLAEWATDKATLDGFERAATRQEKIRVIPFDKPRFAVVYHLLSVAHNHRIRLKVFVDEDDMIVDSVINLWQSADWFEREAFDLFGILFDGHPDLRRILTDYGFIGHPFRKDFPLIGTVEMRYDASQQRVVYEPVSIQPRVLVPKVIREDSRYTAEYSEQPIKKEASD